MSTIRKREVETVSESHSPTVKALHGSKRVKDDSDATSVSDSSSESDNQDKLQKMASALKTIIEVI